jgi:hypothetical protein
LLIKKKKKASIDGRFGQEADYMAESESEVGEADMEIEAHVYNFLTIDILCISLCLSIKHAV